MELCWYDGEYYTDGRIPITVNDPGLLFGATVFSTLRVYGGDLNDPRTAWPAHRQRLETTIARFGWHQPNWDYIDQGLGELIPHYPILRVTIFPGGRELVTGRDLPQDLDALQRQGITAWVAPPDRHARLFAADKTGNYLGAWLALQTARSQGSGEAILIDDAGRWLETSTGNLWGYRDCTWYTPPIDGSILPGIARQRILEVLRSPAIATQLTVNDQQYWTPDFYQSLEFVAYSNSVVEVVPIVTVRFGVSHEQTRTLTFSIPTDRSPLNSLRLAFDASPAADEVLESPLESPLELPSDGQMN